MKLIKDYEKAVEALGKDATVHGKATQLMLLDIAHSQSKIAEAVIEIAEELKKRPRYEDVTQEDIEKMLSGKIKP